MASALLDAAHLVFALGIGALAAAMSRLVTDEDAAAGAADEPVGAQGALGTRVTLQWWHEREGGCHLLLRCWRWLAAIEAAAAGESSTPSDGSRLAHPTLHPLGGSPFTAHPQLGARLAMLVLRLPRPVPLAPTGIGPSSTSPAPDDLPRSHRRPPLCTPCHCYDADQLAASALYSLQTAGLNQWSELFGCMYAGLLAVQTPDDLHPQRSEACPDETPEKRQTVPKRRTERGILRLAVRLLRHGSTAGAATGTESNGSGACVDGAGVAGTGGDQDTVESPSVSSQDTAESSAIGFDQRPSGAERLALLTVQRAALLGDAQLGNQVRESMGWGSLLPQPAN